MAKIDTDDAMRLALLATEIGFRVFEAHAARKGKEEITLADMEELKIRPNENLRQRLQDIADEKSGES